MKILDILFVVFELYNFVGLFKLRKSDKKEIKVIKEQKATEHMNEELIRMIKLRIQGLPDEVEKFMKGFFYVIYICKYYQCFNKEPRNEYFNLHFRVCFKRYPDTSDNACKYKQRKH